MLVSGRVMVWNAKLKEQMETKTIDKIPKV